MSARAGIVVTGTEVLTGRVADRNGPWLADRLEELGVDLAQIAIVGDRREDLLAALRFMAAQRFDVVLTSGGLGPTADDLTAEVVAELQGRELVWDGPLQERIEAIVARLGARWRNVSAEAMREGARKQATIPAGATVLEPVGTAPGLVVTPAEGRDRPHGGRAPRPAARAAADVGGGGARRLPRGRPAARGAGRRHHLPSAHAAPVRDPRVGDRRDFEGGRARGRAARAPGGHHLPETGRGGGGDALRARRRRTPTTSSLRRYGSATSSSCSPRTVPPWTSRWRRCCEEAPGAPPARSPRRSRARAACSRRA